MPDLVHGDDGWSADRHLRCCVSRREIRRGSGACTAIAALVKVNPQESQVGLQLRWTDAAQVVFLLPQMKDARLSRVRGR